MIFKERCIFLFETARSRHDLYIFAYLVDTENNEVLIQTVFPFIRCSPLVREGGRVGVMDKMR